MPLQSAGGGGSGKGSSDVRAGGAFYELFAVDKVSAVLDKIQAKVKRFGEFMKRIGTTSLVGGAALGAGPLALFLGGSNRLADVARLAKQFELPIQVMNKLHYAAEQAGVSVSDVMNDTKGLYRDLLDRAPVIDPAQAQQALAAQRDFKDATIALQMAMTPLLAVVAPLVRDVAEFIKQNAAGVQVLAGVAAGLLAFGLAAKVVGIAVAGVAAVIGLASAAIGVLLSPIGIVIGLFGLLAYQMRGPLTEAFKNLGEIFSETWGGIKQAVEKGDLQLAFQIAAIGIKKIWYGLLIDLGKAFAAWIEDHRTQIIALGALMGAIKGDSLGGRVGRGAAALGKAGSRLAKYGGPIGRFLGTGLGAAAGGFGADALADELKGLGNNPALEARLAALDAEMKALLKKAAEPRAGGPGGGDPDAARRRFEAVHAFDAIKQAFAVPYARLQFGYGDKTNNQTELLRLINDGKGGLPGAIGAAVGKEMKVK